MNASRDRRVLQDLGLVEIGDPRGEMSSEVLWWRARIGEREMGGADVRF
jgi:hypothetical protein